MPVVNSVPTLGPKQVRAAQRALYCQDFYEFVKAGWSAIDRSDFKDNWHVKVLCDHLQAAVDPVFAAKVLTDPDDPILRLLINIAPGTGKSLIINVLFPAWVWTRWPEKRILSTSHKEKLAIRDSTKTRRLIESEWYQTLWPIKLRGDQNAKASFENTCMGAREASPFSSITGQRAGIVIVDDPHSVDDAKSDAYRTSAVDTFRETIPSRINDPATDVIIVVMQRLHMDDVSGFILDNPDLGYCHLCIPYIADGKPRPATKIGWVDHREEGELMFPGHFNEAFLKQQRASLGPFQFAGQYQQNPVPEGDGFFKAEWFHRYDPAKLPSPLNYYMTSDHAPGGKGDWNVFRIWGVDSRRNLYLVDSFRKKCTMDIAIGAVRGPDGIVRIAAEGALPLIAKWKPLGWFPENDNTWVAIQPLIKAMMFETQVFCRIDPLPTKGSGNKEGKAQAYQAMAANGMIHLPKGEVGDLAIEEYCNFPAGRHDDQVDADGAIARVIAQAHAAIAVPVEVKRERVEDWDRGSDHSELYWG